MNNRSSTLLAVFSEPQDLIEGVRAVLRNGYEKLEVLSPIPLPELEELLPQRPSMVRWFTLLGCIGGAVLGMGLQVATALDWPLPTGGKPIVSLPAFVVIAFEMTILLGALATMGGLMFKAKLPSITKEVYHEGCSQSEFALIVSPDTSDLSSLEARLHEAGAREIRVVEKKPSALEQSENE